MLALPSLIDTVYLLTVKCLLEAKKEEDIIPKIFMLTDVSYEQYTILFFFFYANNILFTYPMLWLHCKYGDPETDSESN